MKMAKIYPLFKSGDRSLVINCGPISILPAFSKIIEKLVYKSLMSYLCDHNILYQYQFGFRPNHDTSLAVMEMVDQITAAVDAKKNSLGIFIDLSHDWFCSYLKNRQQYVDYKGCKSTLMNITCGVPQGPLLFLIYINDIANVSNLLHLILFADDTNIFI